jgi:hypothetical protein
MITSNGQPYMNWQTRVFYRTWLASSKEKGSPLKHFTRVLHRTRDDELMLEIPTVRIDPTHAECDNGCDYAVKDRARAIAEWAETKDARRCSHVLMAEADYVMLKSPPRSVMLQRGHAYGFLFGYIIPWHADALPASRVLHDVERYGRYEDVPQSGNAPQVMHGDDLRKIAEVRRLPRLLSIRSHSRIARRSSLKEFVLILSFLSFPSLADLGGPRRARRGGRDRQARVRVDSRHVRV